MFGKLNVVKTKGQRPDSRGGWGVGRLSDRRQSGSTFWSKACRFCTTKKKFLSDIKFPSDILWPKATPC